VPLKELLESDKEIHSRVLSHNPETNEAEMGTISCFKAESQHSRLLAIEVLMEGETVVVECFKESTFETS
jgi:VIT1/CCC1 family predicted Fe2+/Mn2+ transporter